MENWKLLVLEHDNPSKEIADFFEKVWKDGIIRKNIIKKGGERTCYTQKHTIRKKIEESAGNLEGKILTIYGHGYFHHYTYGLCNVTAKKRSENYIYIHIDNHSDSYYDADGYLRCGSFVKNILEEPEAKDILFVGTDYLKEHSGIDGEYLVSKNAKRTLKKVLREKPQPDAYPSLDLDVLAKTEIATGYGQGILKLKNLLNIIKVIKNEKNIISADILGYEGKDLEDSSTSPEVSLLAYAALAAKITRKDTKELGKMHTYFKRQYLKESKTSREEFEKITEQLKI